MEHYNPIDGLLGINRTMLDFITGPSMLDAIFGPKFNVGGYTSPQYEVRENEDSIVVEMDLPGHAKKDLNVTVQDGVLYIFGSRESSADESDRVISMRQNGKFRHRFVLHVLVDEEDIQAKYKQGVLTITLKKVESEILAIDIK